MTSGGSEILLVRHGDTEWSSQGRHTGRTDVPLTERGEDQARSIAPLLDDANIGLVLSSPLQRAWRTAELAGLQPITEPDLMEWDYGAYEGLTTAQIRETKPDWSLWRDGVPAGEAIENVAHRAQVVLDRALEALADGDVVLVSHGHVLRVLSACWLGLPPQGGALLALDTATVSALGFERENRVIRRWNMPAS
jgi:probable phosphoglycerate mutase